MTSKNPLKISIGMKLRSGPWGGSNQFGVALAEYLEQRGHIVSFDLKSPDLDIIVLTDPRSGGASATYQQHDIMRYLIKTNWRALVVHRVNECDERKGTTGVNAQLMAANNCADHTVFISHWLRDLFLKHGLDVADTSSVVLNGADQRIFHANGYQRWNHREKLRLVTHHWGGGWLKGFDIYQQLDHMLQAPTWKDRIDFTYIGNVPDGFSFRNTTYLEPQHGDVLADSLRNHHVYLTASQYEPAGMHHVEGALCGLPLLYRESGALPDYGDGFGVSFTMENFEQQLHTMLETYDDWVERMPVYRNTAERMCAEYYQLFLRLGEQRKRLLRKRTIQLKRPVWFAQMLWRNVRKRI
ncbi:MAG: glycosyltransferase [Lentisphaerae bacterium]|nr:glycosyltransferase [Lentisphaerota bacterium]